MIQAPTDSNRLLSEIVTTLISRFHPSRVYLFGSRARGDQREDSDYDFLIEIDRRPDGGVITRQEMTRLTDFPGVDVEVHLRAARELEQRKDDPGTIDWDVVREGRLLYSIPGLPVLQPGGSSRVKEPEPPRPESVREWVRFSERDLFHARHHFGDELENWSDEVCFLAQQAAEKILKALIVSRSVRPRRTHNLDELLTDLHALGVDVANLAPDCSLLSNYAVDPRYPGSYRSRESARMAFEAAERIVATVRRHLP